MVEVDVSVFTPKTSQEIYYSCKSFNNFKINKIKEPH